MKVFPDWLGGDVKSKGGKPGELMESAKRKYLSKSGRFLLAEARQQKEQNKKDTKIILKKAKLANKYTAWAVDGGLQCGVGWGLVAFRVPEQAPRALLRGEHLYYVDVSQMPEIEDLADGRTRWACVGWRGEDGETEVRLWGVDWEDEGRMVLHAFFDLGSKGLPSHLGWFLDAEYQLNGWAWPDPCHKRIRGIENGLQKAGKKWMKTESVIVSNAFCGPHHQHGFAGQVVGAGRELFASFTAKDEPLYQEVATKIARMLNGGILPVAAFSDGFFDELFERLSAMECVFAPGLGETKMARWGQWQRKTRSFLPWWAPCLHLVMYIALHCDWYPSVDESPLNPRWKGDIREASNVPPDDGAREVKSSSAHVDKLWSSSRGTLHLVCKLLCSRRLRALLVFYCAVSSPVEVDLFNCYTSLMTKAGILEYYTTWAARGGSRVIARMLRDATSTSLAIDAGLWPDGEDVDDMEFDEEELVEMAKACALLLRVTIAGEAAYGRLHSANLPGKFFQLLLARERDAALQWLESVWRKLLKFEHEALRDPVLRQWLNHLLWPRNVWTRGNLIALDECEFKAVPSRLDYELRGSGSVAGGSIDTELIHGEVKKAARGGLTVGPAFIWHRGAQSNVIPRCGKKRVVATPADRRGSSDNGGSFVLPKGIFASAGQKYSLGEEALQSTLQTRFPKTSPVNYTLLPYATEALRVIEDSQALLRTFLSAFMREGDFVRRVATPSQIYWVVDSSHEGCELVRISSRALTADVSLLEIQEETCGGYSGETEMVHVTDVDEWEVLPVRTTSAVIAVREHRDWKHLLAHRVYVWLLDTTPPDEFSAGAVAESLLQRGVEEGFRGVTAAILGRALGPAGLDIRGKKPKNEVGILYMIFRRLRPCATFEQLQEWMTRRKNSLRDFDKLMPNLDEEEANAAADFAGEGEEGEVEENVAKEGNTRRPRKRERQGEEPPSPKETKRRRDNPNPPLPGGAGGGGTPTPPGSPLPVTPPPGTPPGGGPPGDPPGGDPPGGGGGEPRALQDAPRPAVRRGLPKEGLMTAEEVNNANPPLLPPGVPPLKIVFDKAWQARYNRKRTAGQGSYTRTYNSAKVDLDTGSEEVRAEQRAMLYKVLRWLWWVYSEEGGTIECSYHLGETNLDEMV